MAIMQANLETKDVPGQVEYMAFISYRHADNYEDGRKWADWLHHILETYEISTELVGQPNQFQQRIPSQIYPVFQDEKELSVDSDLSASIQRALDRTQTLVVLCSPQSVKSRYVEEEIAYFKQLGRAKRIIAVILYGQPGGKEEGNVNEQECFPLPLRHDVTGTEHLAADVRTSDQQQGFTTPHAYRAWLESQHKYSRSQVQTMTNAYRDRLELAKLKIIAGILGVSLADLTKRDKAYQLQKAQKRQKVIKRVAIGFAFLFLLALASGVYAWLQQKETQRTFAQSLFNIGVERMEGRKEEEGAAYLAAAARLGNKDALLYAHSLLGNLREKPIIFPDTSKPSDIVFSPDGKTMAMVFTFQAGEDRAELRDMATMKLLHTFSRKGENLSNFAFSEDGRYFFGLSSKVVYGWEVSSGKPAGPAIPTDSASLFNYFWLSPSGKYLIMGYATNKYAVYHTATGVPTSSAWEHNTVVAPRTVFFNDEELAASYELSRDSALHIHALADTLIAPKEIFLNDQISKLKHGPVKEQLVAITSRKIIIVDGVQGVVLDTISIPFVDDVRFNPDGRTMALMMNSGNIKIVDRITHQLVKELPAPGFWPANASKRAPDGIHILRSSRLIELREQGYRQVMLPPFFDNTELFALSPDGKRMYTLSDKDAAIKVWDALRGVPLKVTVGGTDTVRSFSLSRNYNLLMSGTATGKVQIWDANTGAPAGPAFKHDGPVLFVQDNKEHTVLMSIYNNNMVQCWSIKEHKPLGKPLQYKDMITAVQLSYDGRYLAVGTGKGLVEIWDPEQQRQVVKPLNYASRVRNCQFSPDNKLIAVALDNGQIEVIDVAKGSVILHFSVQTNKGVVRFSPDSKKLLVMANAHEVLVRELSTGIQTGDAMYHQENIDQVFFSPDNKWLLTISGFGSRVRFWNPENGKAVSGYIDYSQFGRAGFARFSGDGNRVMIYSLKNKTMHILSVWEVPGLLNMQTSTLADGVEALFGRRYNIKRGILENVDQGKSWDSLRSANRRNWYFEEEEIRSTSPVSGLTQPAYLMAYIPLRNEDDAKALESAFPLHPLSRAALAEYYSRRGETGFWAEDLIKMVRLQLRTISDAALKEKVERWVKRAEKNIQQLKANGI